MSPLTPVVAFDNPKRSVVLEAALRTEARKPEAGDVEVVVETDAMLLLLDFE